MSAHRFVCPLAIFSSVPSLDVELANCLVLSLELGFLRSRDLTSESAGVNGRNIKY